ncbi:MAG: DNA polymerase III subunit delta' [Candidatus Omnitrophica bacterium]|nr:DNA polymerase III subunit delta' [Candidatus Omnitrophota bacterium]
MPFKDIKGQKRPIELLQGYLKTGQIPGAFLFCGQEGIGKNLAAINFAQALNCLESNMDACGNCSSCVKISKKDHPDIHEVSAQESEEIKIDQVRELKRSINLRPYEARKKVFIINDAHRLNPESSNALLKVLEEPPGNSLIILITAKPQLLFKTIMSRCQVIRFYPLSRDNLKDILVKDYSVPAKDAHYLSFYCEGRLGSALKLKSADALVFKNSVIDGFIYSGDTSCIDSLAKEERKEIAWQINILAGWFRDVYFAKIGMPADSLINLDRQDMIHREAERYSQIEINEIMSTLTRSLGYLERNIGTKLLLSNLRIEIWKS